MSAFTISTFKFIRVTSESGIIKAVISEQDGFFGQKAIYTQREIQIYGLIKAAKGNLGNHSSSRRLRKNIDQLIMAFDAVRRVKIDNKIPLDVTTTVL